MTERLEEILSPEERRAVDRFVHAVTIPLIEHNELQAAVLGTGNLLEVLGRFFLVSASHTFKDFDPDRAGIPASDGGRLFFKTLHACKRYYWDDDGLDVTVLEFPDEAFVAHLRPLHQFLTPANLAAHGTNFDQYLVYGYPSAAALTRGLTINPRAVRIVSTPYEGRPPPNFQPDREFLLEYAERGWDEAGDLQETMALPGISGAAVWGIDARPSGIWSASAVVKMVGVQHAYLKSAYIRCHYWWIVARMFAQIDSALGDAVLAHVRGA